MTRGEENDEARMTNDECTDSDAIPQSFDIRNSSLRISTANDFHDPAVEVREHRGGEVVAAGILTQGDGAAGGMQQAEVAADVGFGIGFAGATRCDEAGKIAQGVDVTEGTVVCGECAAKCGDAGETAWMIPGGAE